jgi:hypothetical protein
MKELWVVTALDANVMLPACRQAQVRNPCLVINCL